MAPTGYVPVLVQKLREEYKRQSESPPPPVRKTSFESIFRNRINSNTSAIFDFRDHPVFDPEPTGVRSMLKEELKDFYRWHMKEKKKVAKLRLGNVDDHREEKIVAHETGMRYGRRCLSFD